MKPPHAHPQDPAHKEILHKTRPQPAANRRFFLLPWFDIPLLLLILAAAIAWAWMRHSAGQNERPFPRQPTEFRAPAELEKAKADLQSVTQKEPENIAAWIDLSLVAYESGKEHYVEGLESLERARDLGALDDRLFYYAGVMYEAEGLVDYARPEYERFLRHHPDDQEARLRLGNLYYRTEDLDRAIEQYEKILAARPADPLVSYNLALAYRDKERWPDGLRVLDEAVSAGKALPDGDQKLYGDLHRGAGDLAKAMEHYNLALSQQKDDAGLWESMALSYEELKDYAQALTAWKRVQEINPKHRKARDKARQMQRKVKSKS